MLTKTIMPTNAKNPVTRWLISRSANKRVDAGVPNRFAMALVGPPVTLFQGNVSKRADLDDASLCFDKSTSKEIALSEGRSSVALTRPDEFSLQVERLSGTALDDQP